MTPLLTSLPGLLRIAGFTLVSSVLYGQTLPDLDPAQTEWLGEQIFTNECNRQPACLTAWNAGEAFPSLGIGHFIWFRDGQQEIFEESFPQLLAFMDQRGLALPRWIEDANRESPWQNREAFLADTGSDRLIELRAFLLNHKAEQTAFMIRRFSGALEAMTASLASEAEAARLQANFYRVANASPPHGLYALIDYVNFKGVGVAPGERYAGRGWGLKQVLLAMADDRPPIAAFVEAARAALRARVANAPPARNEQRWLEGWNNRLDTYLPATPEYTP